MICRSKCNGALQCSTADAHVDDGAGRGLGKQPDGDDEGLDEAEEVGLEEEQKDADTVGVNSLITGLLFILVLDGA